MCASLSPEDHQHFEKARQRFEKARQDASERTVPRAQGDGIFSSWRTHGGGSSSSSIVMDQSPDKKSGQVAMQGPWVKSSLSPPGSKDKSGGTSPGPVGKKSSEVTFTVGASWRHRCTACAPVAACLRFSGVMVTCLESMCLPKLAHQVRCLSAP
jgi:hypothetical protein